MVTETVVHGGQSVPVTGNAECTKRVAQGQFLECDLYENMLCSLKVQFWQSLLLLYGLSNKTLN